MKKIYSILVFIIFCGGLYGQNISVQLETGMGQYNMKEMKDLQNNYIIMVNDLDVKSVVQFPATLYYGIKTDYLLNKKNSLGVHLFYNTTAGRNHLADYSGEYKMDILLSSYAIGVDYSYLFCKLGKFKIGANLGIGMRLSTFKIKESLIVFSDTVSDSNFKANGTNLYTLPAIEISYPLLKRLDLKIKTGYEIDFRSKYVTTNDDGEQQILYFDGDRTLNIDYSGLRISIGVAYKF